jgi:hypothetical protein
MLPTVERVWTRVIRRLAAVVVGLVVVPEALAQAERPTIREVVAGFPIGDRPVLASGAGTEPVVRRRVRLGSWAPVWVRLEGGRQAFRGLLEVACPDDDDLPIASRIPVDLPAGATREVGAFVRPGSSRPGLEVRLLDEAGRLVGRPLAVALEPPLEASQRVVLAAGRAPGLAELAGLFKFQSEGAGVSVGRLDSMPSQWFGMDGVEVVVLMTADPEAAAWMRPEAVTVLRTWVAQGGHLVVVLGANWRETAAALGDLLPARPVGRLRLAEVADLGALESFAGTVSRPIPPPLEVVRLELADATAVPLAAVAATPLVVRGGYGFGRVTILGLDAARPPIADWPDRTLVWDRLVDLRGRSAESTGTLVGGGRGAIIQQADPDLGARLHQALGIFPGVRLVPFGLVASLIFVYLIVIGPLDYLLLRRLLRRMEWTWLTFPLVVVATSVAAFAAARHLKGDRLRVNAIELLDLDQARGIVRGGAWTTAFSPGNLDYRVTVHPRALEWASGDEPSWQSATVSWFGPPDASLAGVGRVALGNRRAAYETPGRLDRLGSIRIPIWSTKSLTARWAGLAPDARLIDADLRPVAGDRVAGSVRNLLDHTLVNARLFYGRNAYDLGTIRPRGIARVDPTRSEAASRYLSRLVQAAERRGPQTEEPEPLRRELLRTALFRDALGSRAEAIPNTLLRSFDLTTHANELRRPILVAEIDAPTAELTLEGVAGEPLWTRSTLIRVILPLEADPASAY